MLQPIEGRCSPDCVLPANTASIAARRLFAGYLNRVARPAPIELAAIHELEVPIEEKEVRRARGPVGFGHRLRLVKQVREAKTEGLRLPSQSGRIVIGKIHRIIAADRHNAYLFAVIVHAQRRQSFFNVLYIWAMRAEEHHE
jgi:hypothetical protein